MKKSTPKPKQDKQTKLQKQVKKNDHFEFIENGKIRCKVTGHEMLPTQDNYDIYLKCKSFKRALQDDFDIKEYDQIIIPHKDSDKFMFCQLTGVRLPKKKTVLARHIAGKRFQRRYKDYLEQQDSDQEVEQIEESDEQGDAEEVINGVDVGVQEEKEIEDDDDQSVSSQKPKRKGTRSKAAKRKRARKNKKMNRE